MISLIWTIPGIFMMILAFIQIKEKSNFKNNARHTMGMITRIHVYGAGEDVEYRADVSFQASNGKLYEGTVESSSWENKGKKIRIYYDPRDPNTFMRDSQFGEICLIIFGVLFFALALIPIISGYIK